MGSSQRKGAPVPVNLCGGYYLTVSVLHNNIVTADIVINWHGRYSTAGILQGKVGLVTGAGTGLVGALAAAFAGDGVNVVVARLR